MSKSNLLQYINSPEGAVRFKEAAAILQAADPEQDDSDLLQKMVAVGIPEQLAKKVFYRCLNRLASVYCTDCGQQFRPKTLSTMHREICFNCERLSRPADLQQKRFARQLATQANQSGKLKRQPCSCCGFEIAQMHHPDYSRPLYVVWLCWRCHAAEHRRLREEKIPPVVGHPLRINKSYATIQSSS